jgi:hypothetical protein
MKKVVRLTEEEMVKKVISEQEEMTELFFDTSDEGGEFGRRTEKERSNQTRNNEQAPPQMFIIRVVWDRVFE